MGREGGLSLFLSNRFHLFRFFYLDGQMWLFMLDMIKELNKQKSLPASATQSGVYILGSSSQILH